MHPYVMPEALRQRLLRRQGKLVSLDTIDGRRAALVVIDMQNYFVGPEFPAEIAPARGIVPNINRMAGRCAASAVWSYGCRPPRQARSSDRATITGT